MTIPSGFEFTGAGWYDRNTGAGPYAYDGVSMTLIAGGGGGGGGTASGGGGVAVVDASGGRWLWVYDRATGTSTFVAFATGLAGTPVYPLTPDADTSVNVGNWPATALLPVGAATEAKQDDAITALGTLDQTGQRVEVELQGLNSTAANIEAAIVALPQDQGVTETQLLAAGLAKEAKQDDLIAAIGARSDASYGGTGNPSAIAALKGIYDNTKGRQQAASWAVATGAGTIAAGATEVSFANIGAGPGLIGGSPIPFGLAVVFSAMAGCTLDSIDYDATGTTIYISEVR